MPLLAGIGPFGPWELLIILLIVVLIFGVGRLPEVGGAVGKSIREFRKATKEPEEREPAAVAPSEGQAPAAAAPSETTFCGECGAKNPRGAKFCSNCGHSIGAPVA